MEGRVANDFDEDVFSRDLHGRLIENPPPKAIQIQRDRALRHGRCSRGKIAMLLSGILLLRWLGALRLMRIGLILSILVFSGVGIVGLAGAPGAFRWMVLALGICAGLTGAGMLSSVAEFTAPERAGLLMGIWGMANMVGHAVGSLMGGIIVDTMRLLTGSAVVAYTSLFACEVVLLVVALGLSLGLSPARTKARAEFAGGDQTARP